jgi:hypothetical protein
MFLSDLRRYALRHHRERGTRVFGVLVLSILAWSVTAFAKKQPKTYPEEGTVIGTGTSQLLRYTYKVETDAKTYELECDKVPRPGLTSYTPRECGGAKKIQIGDVIHFRNEKAWAYIPVNGTDGQSGEQRLRILREELKPASKAADKTQAAEPARADEKQ